MMSYLVVFLVPLLSGLAIVLSGTDNKLLKGIGYALVIVFGLCLFLFLL